MNTEKWYRPAKIALLLPFICGFLTLAEQLLPLQTMNTVVANKHISESSKSGTTYNIDFSSTNDQFTEELYNHLKEGDDVVLQVLRFSKEVKTVQLVGNPTVWENSTSEVYFQLGFGVVFLLGSVYFWRKKYFTNKNYRYIAVLCLLGLVALVRLINLNL